MVRTSEYLCVGIYAGNDTGNCLYDRLILCQILEPMSCREKESTCFAVRLICVLRPTPELVRAPGKSAAAIVIQALPADTAHRPPTYIQRMLRR